MFGTYDIPLNIEREDLSLSVERAGGNFLYQRDCRGDKVKRYLLAEDQTKVMINPVEPVNKPKALTSYLLIKFEKPVIVGPKSEYTVYLTFPVETGMYVSKNGQYMNFDIFTLSRQKYAIYGNPANGVLCKYWKSEVHSAPPSPDPLYEGVMELKISNETTRWTKVTKAVFNAAEMKIYFSDQKVGMKARMDIESRGTAKIA